MIVTFLELGLVAEGLPDDIAALYKLIQAQKVQLIQNIVMPKRRPIGRPKATKKPRYKKATVDDVVKNILGYIEMHESGIHGSAWVVLHTAMKHTKLSYPKLPLDADRFLSQALDELRNGYQGKSCPP